MAFELGFYGGAGLRGLDVAADGAEFDEGGQAARFRWEGALELLLRDRSWRSDAEEAYEEYAGGCVDGYG